MPLFTPELVVSQLWLDAADGGSVVLDAGVVSQVNDKSGNERHYLQATAGARPSLVSHASGNNVLEFSAAEYLYGNDQAKDITRAYSELSIFTFVVSTSTNYADIFTVTFPESESYPRFDLDTGSTASNTIRLNVCSNDLSGSLSSTTVAERPSNSIIGVTWDTVARTVNLGKNGTYTTTGSMSASGTIPDAAALSTKLSSATTELTIGEIVVLSYIPETDERQMLEGYLAHKWGVNSSLPVDHPYYTDAPRVPLNISVLETIDANAYDTTNVNLSDQCVELLPLVLDVSVYRFIPHSIEELVSITNGGTAAFTIYPLRDALCLTTPISAQAALQFTGADTFSLTSRI